MCPSAPGSQRGGNRSGTAFRNGNAGPRAATRGSNNAVLAVEKIVFVESSGSVVTRLVAPSLGRMSAYRWPGRRGNRTDAMALLGRVGPHFAAVVAGLVVRAEVVGNHAFGFLSAVRINRSGDWQSLPSREMERMDHD